MKKALILLFALTATLVAFAAETVLTGSWTVDNDIAGNTSTAPVVFKQEGNKLTGVIKMPEGKELAISGEIKDQKVSWKYDTEWEGNPLTMAYTGTIDASGAMSGTVEVQPMGVEGTFTAKKSEAKAEKKAETKAEKK